MPSPPTSISSPPPPHHRLKLILLSGASGTGKSTTAYEVCARLRGPAPRKTRHAHIDADNLDALYPRRQGGDLMLKGLRALWGVLWGEMVAEGGDRGRGRGGGEEKRIREGVEVLVVSGTGVVLELEGVRRVVEEVVGGGGDGKHVDVEVLPVVLWADERVVEERLRARVLGEELQEHLESSRRFRRVLAEWEPGSGGGSGDVVVRRVDSGRELGDVVEDVLQACGL